ncbi:MAG: NAD(P)/FAD-dependent oxidoreductase [Pegethrix bostrychoides GSE-TBD4-15B]|uniref:NAD(P)/FAD-dependent oxidoreductase n=1 Tax=Pegethrix bostrychoides GSE-TBD4-15B TaxID=2839662 RepID=A0A951U4T4_9CYAN|nr:NAD(P)/FAD-dependent oxidoreductase [Pegethrix bostrychoides GSE-TBD4-15B]
MQSLQVVVIGGGAAGFWAAIACAEAHPQAQVTLLEARQPLAKVRISGGGRCNVTHACFEPATLVQQYPRGGKALRGAFTRFQPKDTIAWFARHGVQLKTESDGRMFPITDDSETIVSCLLQAARQAGVEIYTASPVQQLEQTQRGFEVLLKSGRHLPAHRLLLATGSSPQGHELARGLGHSIEPPVPSLFTFNIPDLNLHELAGVAVETAEVKLLTPKLEQLGAVLVTHWGLSGPAVLKLSAWGARILHQQRYRAELQINWLPTDTLESSRQVLLTTKLQQPKKTLAGFCPVELPRRFWQYLVSRAEVDPERRWAELSKLQVQALLRELHQGRYQIQGKSIFKDEFVTCGGVRLQEVDFKTMQSRLCPGLFFAGEVLDIDGVTGGFNFQSAWTTGWLAGQAIGAG